MEDRIHRTSPNRFPNQDACRRFVTALFAPDDPLFSYPELRRIGDYLLLRRLGGGGGGDVWEAIRSGRDTHVALKLLRHGMGDERVSRRAYRELDLLDQLHLPCIPQLRDYGTENGQLYFVTDFVEGLPLDRYCEVHNLALDDKLRLLVKVARAVQMLNEHGIIHRDLKPSNIIIDLYGQPMIVDLGIAHFAELDDDERATITQTRSLVGTLDYMAPEQARAENNSITVRSDVYSLAATALYILTGKKCHHTNGPIDQVLSRIAREPVASIRTLAPALPKPIAGILSVGLRLEPQKRFASAGDFADELDRYLRHEPIKSEEISLWGRTRLAVRRRPSRWIAAAASIALVLASGGIIWSIHTARTKQLRAEHQSDVIRKGILMLDDRMSEGGLESGFEMLKILNMFAAAGRTDPAFKEELAERRARLSLELIREAYAVPADEVPRELAEIEKLLRAWAAKRTE